MKTYKMPTIKKQCVEKFQYVYPESVMVKNIKFYHSYLGLYIGVDSEPKTEEINRFNGYGNLSIFQVMQSGDCERKRYSNLLFMYSDKYSTWDRETLELYLKYHKESLSVPEQWKEELEKISKGLRLDDRTGGDLEFSSLSYSERIAKFGFYDIILKEIFTYNEREVEEIPISDVFLEGLSQVIYHPAKDAFDITFEFPVTEDYIVCNGKVGTKICSDVYEFFDNLDYREKYDENQLDVCKPWNPRSLDNGIYGLGKELWGHFASFAQSFNGYSIHYVTRNKNSEEFLYLKDKHNLVFLSYCEKNKIEESIIEDECDRTAEDIINEYKAKGFTEVFDGAGFVGDWEVNFKKIFDFKCSPKKISGKICMLSDSDILLISHSLKKTIQLNKQVLRYLRVELKDIGHTFIKENDENEIALFGEQLVEYMKIAEDSSYF